nr:LamG domain-containing protein [Polymorphospora rubra]
MTFDGVEDRVHIPYSNATNLGSSPFTISTWFKYSGGTARQTLLWGYGVNEAISQLWIRADPADNSITTSARTPNGVVRINTDNAYADNAWHFLALRRTDSQLILSIDGQDVGTAPAPTGSLTAGYPDGVRGIHLGEKLDGTDPLTGTLDELRIYTPGRCRPPNSTRCASTTPHLPTDWPCTSRWTTPTSRHPDPGPYRPRRPARFEWTRSSLHRTSGGTTVVHPVGPTGVPSGSSMTHRNPRWPLALSGVLWVRAATRYRLQ